MKSIVYFVLLISVCLAQEENNESPIVKQRQSRAPQGHIQYSDPDGLKVSWKLYAPYTQWKSHLQNSERNERAETGTAQPSLAHHQADLIQPAAAATEEKPVPAQPVHQVQVQYKPYSMVPTHIKQLILEMYQPQGPYIDPSVYVYQAPAQQEEEQSQKPESNAADQDEQNQATSQTQARYEYNPKYYSKYLHSKGKVGYIQYKNEEPIVEATAAPQYGAVPERKEPTAEEQEQQQRSNADDDMPKELHQLLNLQAQTPYHVIANRIYYKPKTIFVPKPFTDDVKGPYKYRSKVYYIKGEDEEQQYKERTEREEPKEQPEPAE